MSVASFDDNHAVADGCVVEEPKVVTERSIPLIGILARLTPDAGTVAFIDCDVRRPARGGGNLFDVVADAGNLCFAVDDVQNV